MTCRTHLLMPDATEEQQRLRRGLCGVVGSPVSEMREAVTCRLCIRRMADMAPPVERFSWRDVIDYVLQAISCAGIPAPPPLTRDEWPLMTCRAGASVDACACVHCAWVRRHRASVAEWERSQSLRPHRQHAHQFGSLNAALEFWRWWATGEGMSARSQQGSAQSRMEQVRRLGTEVQTTRRFDRDALEIERAGYAVDIDRAITRVLGDEQMRRGLDARVCVAVLARSVDASAQWRAQSSQIADELGVSDALVRALISALRRAIKVDLAARGVIPEPRHQEQLAVAIAARRAEIERRAVR